MMATIEYAAEVRHDGRLHTFTVPGLRLPVCGACGEKVFTEDVDQQINDALRLHLKFLAPVQIRNALKRLDLSQKEVARRLGIAEETLSRWLNETQIQSRSMDNLLRVFLAFPQVRAALCRESQDSELGMSDLVSQDCLVLPRESAIPSERPRYPTHNLSWPNGSSETRIACARVQKMVQKGGSTWGVRSAR
jgi:transcriptional regulator with XRE-family HTH domain